MLNAAVSPFVWLPCLYITRYKERTSRAKVGGLGSLLWLGLGFIGNKCTDGCIHNLEMDQTLIEWKVMHTYPKEGHEFAAF